MLKAKSQELELAQRPCRVRCGLRLCLIRPVPFSSAAGVPTSGGNVPKWNGQDGLRADEFLRPPRRLSVHRVVVADGQHRQVRVVQVADQLHVGEDRRVACMVEDGAVIDGDDESVGSPP